MAMVMPREDVGHFFDVAQILETSTTWGELATRLYGADADDFMSAFGVETPEGLPENYFPWEPDAPFDPDQLVTYEVVPSSPLLARHQVPKCIADLYRPVYEVWNLDVVGDETLPSTSYDEALRRMRAAGYKIEEVPGLILKIVDRIHGGELM
jgi:hypothetical protein